MYVKYYFSTLSLILHVSHYPSDITIYPNTNFAILFDPFTHKFENKNIIHLFDRKRTLSNIIITKIILRNKEVRYSVEKVRKREEESTTNLFFKRRRLKI